MIGRWQPTEILRRIPTVIESSTRPYHVVTDQGNAYVKMPNNPEGSKALASELIGTRLAEWFGLPVLEYNVISLSEADVNPDVTDSESATVVAFVSAEEPGVPWNGSVMELSKVENVEDLSRVVVFDTWVGNVDRHCFISRSGGDREHRNERNVFLSENASPGKFTFKAYDHTHCQFALIMSSPENDLMSRIEDERVYGLFPEFRTYLNRNTVREAANTLRTLDDETIRKVIESVPNEWVASSKVRDLWADYIKCRSVFVSERIESRLFAQGDIRNE